MVFFSKNRDFLQKIKNLQKTLFFQKKQLILGGVLEGVIQKMVKIYVFFARFLQKLHFLRKISIFVKKWGS